MVKKIRYQENRKPRRRSEPREAWAFEPLDGVLLAIAAVAVVWLQWLAAASHG